MVIIGRSARYTAISGMVVLAACLLALPAYGGEPNDAGFDSLLNGSRGAVFDPDDTIISVNTGGLLLGADADKLNRGAGSWSHNWFDDLDDNGAHDSGEPFADTAAPGWGNPVELPDLSCWIAAGCNMLAAAGAGNGDEQSMYEMYCLNGVTGPEGETLTWDDAGLQHFVIEEWISTHPSEGANMTCRTYRPGHISVRLNGVYFWQDLDVRTTAAEAIAAGDKVGIGMWPWYPQAHENLGHAVTISSLGEPVQFPYSRCLVTDSDRDWNLGRHLEDDDPEPPELPENGDINEYDEVAGYGPSSDGFDYGFWVLSYYMTDYLWPGGDVGYLVILEGEVPSGVRNEETEVAIVQTDEHLPEPVMPQEPGVIHADIRVDAINACNGFGLWVEVFKDGEALDIDPASHGHDEITLESAQFHPDLTGSVSDAGASLIDLSAPGPMMSCAIAPGAGVELGPDIAGGVASLTFNYDHTATGEYNIRLAQEELPVGGSSWSTESYFTSGGAFTVDWIPFWLTLGDERINVRSLTFTPATIDIREWHRLTVVNGTGSRRDCTEGEVVPIQAEERTGYRFAAWEVEPPSMAHNVADRSAPNTTITMSDDTTVTATYITDVELTVVPEFDVLPSRSDCSFYADVFIDHVDGFNGFGMRPVVLNEAGEQIIDSADPAQGEITFDYAELHPDLLDVVEAAGASLVDISIPGESISYAIVPASPSEPGPSFSGGLARLHFNVTDAEVGTYELRMDDEQVNLGGGLVSTESYLSTGTAYTSVSIPTWYGPDMTPASYLRFGSGFIRSGLYELTVVNGTGSGTFEEATQAPVHADAPPGERFIKWTVQPVEMAQHIADVYAVDTTITMFGDAELTPLLGPEANLTVIPEPQPLAPAEEGGQFYVDVFVDILEGCNGFSLTPIVMKDGDILDIDPGSPTHSEVTFDHAELHQDLLDAVQADSARLMDVGDGDPGVAYAIIPAQGDEPGPDLAGGVTRFYFNYSVAAGGEYQVAVDDAEEAVDGSGWSTTSYFSSGTAFVVRWIPHWLYLGTERVDSAFLNFYDCSVNVRVAGDINADGCVNIADLLTVRDNLGHTASGIIPSCADTNSDDVVNIADLLHVRNSLGKGNCN